MVFAPSPVKPPEVSLRLSKVKTRIKFTFNEMLIGMPADVPPFQAGGVSI